LKVTVDPGFSVWKIVPICVNVAFNDAAANTVSVPGAAGAADAAALDDAVLLLELQPTTKVATPSAASIAPV
jgi:hypothetical protein